MLFGLKNVGATYMRAMTTMFHDMMYKEIEVYVDDVIIKSKCQDDHVKDLRKFFERLRRYNLKLNLAKCIFGVSSGKLLWFVVSRRRIELDPSKIKAIQDLPPPKNRTELMSFLGRLNYISRFISQLTTTCEPIFKLLKKSVVVEWTEECQEEFNRIKRYLSNPPVLVPPEPGRPLILYLSVMDNSFDCVLGQHNVTSKKEQAIYYLSKKFTAYEARYTFLERTCCALTWVAQKLKHYLLSYTTYLISHMDPLKYIFQKPMPTDCLAKWQILLTEFNIVYMTRTAIKAQALVDHLTDNLIDEEYEPLKTYFPDEEVLCVDEVIIDADPGWKLFFYGVVNMKVFEIGSSQRFVSVKFRHILRIRNEIADALATLSSMLQHPDKPYIDPVHLQSHDQHAYCNVVEKELDGEPWFFDIKQYIQSVEYPTHATNDKKRTIRRFASGFLLSGGILYKRTPNLGLLRLSHEKFPFALIGYRTTVRTSTGATPYLLVYGTEEVIPAEVKIPSFRVVLEAEIDDDEWVKTRLEQLSLIEEKSLTSVCYGQLYQKRMARAYNKKVRPRNFEVGQLVLKCILPHQVEAKGKFSPNWKPPEEWGDESRSSIFDTRFGVITFLEYFSTDLESQDFIGILRVYHLAREYPEVFVFIRWRMPQSILYSEDVRDQGPRHRVRGKKSYPHGKSWTKAKRILAVMNVEIKYFLAVEILLYEENIKIYDCNLPVFNEVTFLTHVKPLLKLFPKLLTQSKLMDYLPMEVLRKESWLFEDRTGAACGPYSLAYIECLLIGTEMTGMCNAIVGKM
ncbi:putative 40S ribosomal protein S21-like [Capsicum annuum]|nr:putative 40S ribosomal protein S21-like [Capsicum annuum]